MHARMLVQTQNEGGANIVSAMDEAGGPRGRTSSFSETKRPKGANGLQAVAACSLVFLGSLGSTVQM